jgi:hypothetical protein
MASGNAAQMKIIIEAETPGDSRTLFRITLAQKVIGEELTAAEAHLLVGEILERIALPRRSDPGVR